MATTLSRQEVIALARLARLELSEAEITRYQTELAELLTYVEQLSEVDSDGLEPTSQVSGLVNVWRDDEVRAMQATPDTLLKHTPTTRDRYIQVKRML